MPKNKWVPTGRHDAWRAQDADDHWPTMCESECPSMDLQLAWSQTEPAPYYDYPPTPAAPQPALGRGPWHVGTKPLIAAGAILVGLLGTVFVRAHHPDSHHNPAITADAGTTGDPASPANLPVPDIQVPDARAKDTSPDTLFLSTLRTGTTGWDVDPDSVYIGVAHWVCQARSLGYSITDTVTALSKGGTPVWPIPATQFYVATAMAAYCPQYAH